MKKRLLSSFMVLAMVLTMLPTAVFATSTAWDGTTKTAFADGDGTVGDPYQIATGEELAYLADNIATYASSHFILTDNIDLGESQEWTPIGDGSHQFTGTFNGNGKEVSGLYINVSAGSTEYYYAGLFGYVDGGTVKNVTVSGSVNVTDGNSRLHAGGLVGYNYGGTVTNCASAVAVSAVDATTNYAGGVVGKNEEGFVTNCYATGAVSASGSSNTNFVGGVVGYGYHYYGGTEANCYATGAVFASGGSGTAHAGGVVGYIYGTVANCYATGAVTADGGSGTTYAGGVAGKNGGTVSHCYWDSGTTTAGFGYGSGTDCAAIDGGLLADLNAWLDSPTVSGTYLTWASETAFIDHVYEVTTADGTCVESNDALTIEATGTYEIAMAYGEVNVTKAIVIDSSAGDVTLIFDDVTMEVGGSIAIETHSGYGGTLTIQGTLDATSTSGVAIYTAGNLTISGTNTEVTATSTTSNAIGVAGNLEISGADTVVTATGIADSGAIYVGSGNEPTLNDNLIAMASDDSGDTYTQAVTWDSADYTYEYNTDTTAQYIQISAPSFPEDVGGAWTPLTSTGGALSSGNYFLTEDVTLTTDLTIDSSETVNLYLNDYVLTGTGTGSVITVNAGGKLNVYDVETGGTTRYWTDSSGLWTNPSTSDNGTTTTTTGGVITGGSTTTSGGGVYVETYTTSPFVSFTMTGGTIAGNYADNAGGGVYVGDGCTFTMDGGTIAGNQATNGGGVEVAGGTFTMTAGTISHNTAPSGGGGVRAHSGSTFNMTGGSIDGNTSNYGGGVHLGAESGVDTLNMSGGSITNNTNSSSTGTYDGGGVRAMNSAVVNLSGKITITGNTNSANGDCNLYLGTVNNAPKTLSVDTDGLDDDAKIGITLANGTGIFTTGGAAGYITCFSSDSASYGIIASGDNLELCGSVAKVTVDSTTTNYPSITDAVAKANENGGTITLMHDVTTTTTLGISEDVTLDMDGYDITYNEEEGYAITVGSDDTLTLTGTANSEITGGIFVGGTFKLYGALTIDKVYLEENEVITLTGEYTGDAIAVTTAKTPVDGYPVTIVKGGSNYTITSTDKAKFTNGDEDSTATVTFVEDTTNGDTIQLVAPHVHEWVYNIVEVNGKNTIVATCKNTHSTCTLGTTYSATMAGADATYDTKSYIGNDNEHGAFEKLLAGGADGYTVQYYVSDNNDGWSTCDAPTNAGSYKVVVTCDSETFTYEFTIAPYGLTMTGATVDNRAYNGSAEVTLDVSGATVSGAFEGDGAVSINGSATATMSNADVGNGKTFTSYDVALTNDNYVVTGQSGLTVDITELAYAEGSFDISDIAESYYYTGSAITPEPTVKYTGGTGDDVTLVKDTDYTLGYTANKDESDSAPKVTVTFEGNYSGSTDVEFDIVYADTAGNTVIFDDYDDVSTAWDDAVTFTTNTGYTVSSTIDGTYDTSITLNTASTSSLDASTAIVYVKNAEDYIYPVTVAYLCDKTVPSANVSSEPSASGSELSYTVENTATQVSGTTYSGTIANQITVDSNGEVTVTAAGTYTVTATSGAGLTNTVTITVHSVSFGDYADATLVTDGGKVTEPSDPTRTGYSFKQWEKTAGTKFVFDSDTITEDTTLTAVWELKDATITQDAVTTTYNGAAQTIEPSISHDLDDDVSYSYQWYKKSNDVYGEISGAASDTYAVTDVSDSGDYKLKVTATVGTYTSTVEKEIAVTISPLEITDNMISMPTTTYTYTGSAQTSDPTIKFNNGTSDITLTKDTDYTLAYTNNTDAGTATVTISDKSGGNYTLATAIDKTFAIGKATLTPTSASITAGKVYDGTTDLDTDGTISYTGSKGDDEPVLSGAYVWTSKNAGTTTYNVSDIVLTVDTVDTVNANYKILDDFEGLTSQSTTGYGITKIKLTPTIVADGKTYDGDTDATATLTLNLVEGYSSVSGETPTATATYSFDDADVVDADTVSTTNIALETDDNGTNWTTNYELTTASASDSARITPLVATFTWYGENDATDDFSFVYDTTDKTVTAEVSNKVGEDSFTLTYDDNVKTNKGDYTAEVTALGNSNYALSETVTDNQNSWKITKAPVTFTYTAPTGSLVYDTTAQNATVTATWGDNNSFTDFTVAYVGADYDGTAPLNADTYTVTATINEGYRDNYYVVVAGSDSDTTYEKVVTTGHTIGKAQLTAQWQNLTYTYGDNLGALTWTAFTGQIAGDTSTITAKIPTADVPTAAGTYAITAELSSTNYYLSNPTINLVVNKAPITFTVNADGSVNADGFTGYTVTYIGSNGTVYTEKPTANGTYSVVVTVTDNNYRVEGFASGAAIGTYTIGSIVNTYTVTFGTDETTDIPSGSVIVVPGGSNDGDKVFTSWLYSNKSYKAGETFTVTSNAIFTAQYAEAVYGIGGIVKQDGNLMENVVVTLMSGSNVVVTDTTHNDGKYSFSGVTPGTYNVVATYNGITTTILVTITNSNHNDENITLPTGKTNSVVEVTAGTPDVVVGELDTLFKDVVTAGSTANDYTAADKAVVDGKGSVEIKLTVEENSATVSDDSKTLIEEKTSNVGTYLDISLAKTVADSSGTVDDDLSGAVTETSQLLKIIVPLSGDLQGKASYTVYRVHDGVLHTISTTKNDFDEYLEVNNEKTQITLYVKYFSDYALAFTEHSSGSPNVGTVIYPDETTTTETTDDDFPFIDVETEDYYYDAVAWAEENGITSGKSSTTFAPSDVNTRAEAVTFLWRAMGSPESSVDTQFTDLDEDSYYYEAVLWAVENGITMGTTDITFSPYDTCSRAHIVTFLWRMVGELDSDTDNTFDDVSGDDYYFNAILWAVLEEVTNGTSDTTFSPDNDCTRAQIVTFLYRYFGL